MKLIHAGAALLRRMKNHFANGWVALSLLLPLGQPDAWHPVEFKKISVNVTAFATNSMTFRVENSASALVSPVTNAPRVTRLYVMGHVEGAWRSVAEKRFSRTDDMVLRVGLVESGPRRLNGFEQRVAPDWLKEFFRLMPAHAGIAKVHFFNVSARQGTEEREPPRSGRQLVVEQVVTTPEADGRFEFTCPLPQPMKAIAVWLGADGDDSHSSFVVTVERVEIETVKE
ncbi:MAG: hypothetical protein L0Z50_09780 [Verrucomicrobiales bacterium]|nr:hypothetical protein [Verrucomicrobiales bacterium]